MFYKFICSFLLFSDLLPFLPVWATSLPLLLMMSVVQVYAFL